MHLEMQRHVQCTKRLDSQKGYHMKEIFLSKKKFILLYIHMNTALPLLLVYSRRVIDQKRVFPRFFCRERIFCKNMLPNIRPLMNIQHRAENIAKMSICIRKKMKYKYLVSWGDSCKLQLMVNMYGQQKHTVHKTLTMSTKSLLSRKNSIESH
jgi:hypothetical protein